MKRYSLVLIIVSAILLELLGASQFLMAKYGVEKQMLQKAQRDMDESQRVAKVKAEVESAVRNLEPQVREVATDTRNLYRLMSQLVIKNPNVVGAGVAFPRGRFKDKETNNYGLYAPFAYDSRPEAALTSDKKTTPIVRTELLNFDYTDREWFQKPLANGGSLWTAPYMDKGGTHILLTSFAMPITDQSGKRIGVFFADVPLSDVSILSLELNEGISDSAKITLAIQIISFLILAFIIWRAVVAFRRYKVEYVDPEKDHMVEQMAKLREVNTRLTKRNQALAERVAQLTEQVKNNPQTTNTSWV